MTGRRASRWRAHRAAASVFRLSGEEMHRLCTQEHLKSAGFGLAHSIPEQPLGNIFRGTQVSGSVIPQHIVDVQSESPAHSAAPASSLSATSDGAGTVKSAGPGGEVGSGALAAGTLASPPGATEDGAADARRFGESQPAPGATRPNVAKAMPSVRPLTPARERGTVRSERLKGCPGPSR
jgi:hypothetical protein